VDSSPEPAITSAIPRPATILHTSDCHLDEVDDGTPQRAFAAAIDQSIELDVDLLLITGDLFDHNRVGDAILDWTVAQLDRADRPVVLMVGNHDTLDSASVHHRFEAGSRCRQVQFLDDPDGTTVEVPGTDIVVWGRAMVEHEPSFRPLQGHTPRIEGRWHVIAGHGLWVGAPMGSLYLANHALPMDKGGEWAWMGLLAMVPPITVIVASVLIFTLAPRIAFNLTTIRCGADSGLANVVEP